MTHEWCESLWVGKASGPMCTHRHRTQRLKSKMEEAHIHTFDELKWGLVEQCSFGFPIHPLSMILKSDYQYSKSIVLQWNKTQILQYVKGKTLAIIIVLSYHWWVLRDTRECKQMFCISWKAQVGSSLESLKGPSTIKVHREHFAARVTNLSPSCSHANHVFWKFWKFKQFTIMQKIL